MSQRGNEDIKLAVTSPIAHEVMVRVVDQRCGGEIISLKEFLQELGSGKVVRVGLGLGWKIFM